MSWVTPEQAAAETRAALSRLHDESLQKQLRRIDTPSKGGRKVKDPLKSGEGGACGAWWWWWWGAGGGEASCVLRAHTGWSAPPTHPRPALPPPSPPRGAAVPDPNDFPPPEELAKMTVMTAW